MSRKRRPRTPKGKAAFIPGQPSRQEFVEYASSMDVDAKLAGDQFDIWDAGNWCDGNGTPIINWKSKLLTFARAPFGVFLGEKRRHRTRDEVDRRERMIDEAKRMDREDEEREKRK